MFISLKKLSVLEFQKLFAIVYTYIYETWSLFHGMMYIEGHLLDKLQSLVERRLS